MFRRSFGCAYDFVRKTNKYERRVSSSTLTYKNGTHNRIDVNVGRVVVSEWVDRIFRYFFPRENVPAECSSTSSDAYCYYHGNRTDVSYLFMFLFRRDGWEVCAYNSLFFYPTIMRYNFCKHSVGVKVRVRIIVLVKSRRLNNKKTNWKCRQKISIRAKKKNQKKLVHIKTERILRHVLNNNCAKTKLVGDGPLRQRSIPLVQLDRLKL